MTATMPVFRIPMRPIKNEPITVPTIPCGDSQGEPIGSMSNLKNTNTEKGSQICRDNEAEGCKE